MPDIKFATADVSAMKLGTANVSKVMLGDVEVWPGAGACTDVLAEPFSDFTTNGWGIGSGATIVAGRTGTCARFTLGGSATYAVPVPSRSEYLTIGFAYKTSAVLSNTNFLELYSDGTATWHNELTVNVDGALMFVRESSTVLTGAPAGTIAANTWYFIELSCRLHDTLGSASIRVNGVQHGAVTNVDTRNGGTSTVYENVRLVEPSGFTSESNYIDDLYVRTGSGCTFKGDTPIYTPPVAGFTTSSPALVATFTSTSTSAEGTIAAYAWTFGDGATSTTANPTHTYASAGTYTVTLTVTDNHGLTDDESQSITFPIPPTLPTTGLALWLDADDASTFTYSSGVKVSQWRDKSGNNRHFAQTTDVYRPSRNGTQNGHTTVTFDGSNHHLNGTSWAMTKPVTYFAVAKNSATSGQRNVISLNTDGRVFRTSGGTIDLFQGAFLSTGVAWGTTVFHQVTAVFNGASSKIAADGAQTTGNGGASSFTAGAAAVGNYHSGGEVWSGAIAEIAVYNLELSAGDRTAAETYLKTKWATP